MIEGTSGMPQLLAPTAISATVGGITAPSGSTGMKIYVKITAWTGAGTFTINGTASPGADSAVTVAAPTAQQLQSGQLYSFDYVSIGAYTAITNITTTGFTGGGTIQVFGVQAAKFNVPVTSFKANRKVPLYSPNEHNGLMERDKKLIATYNETSIDNLDSDFYGDLSLYWVYLEMGIPSFSTLPAAPLSIIASATIIASMTIANQPTAPGMKLIIVASTFTGSPAITITGTSYGIATSETVTITGNGTYYSANVYSALTTIGGSTNGTTLVITGVYGWKGTVLSGATRQTAAVEHFDGSASWTHPFVAATEGSMAISAKGEAKLTLKGIAQDRLPIGDRTTNPMQISRVTSIGTPLADMPLAGWQTQVWIDAITSTSQTTLFTDPDEEIKIVLKTPTEAHWTFNNQQPFTRAYPIKPEATAELTYDILNLLQYEQFRQNLKQYLVVQMFGRFIGTTGGTTYYEGWTWTLPGRYDGEYGQEADPGKGNVFAKPKWRTEYDSGIGGSYQLVIITQNPPNYNA
jgi:hypothetical protein